MPALRGFSHAGNQRVLPFVGSRFCHFVGVMTWQTWPEPVFAANAKLEPLEQQGPWTLARDVDGAK